MSDEELEKLIEDAEKAVAAAVATHGRDHVIVAGLLEQFASILRKNQIRLLDASNMEARAKLIRRKMAVQDSDAVANHSSGFTSRIVGMNSQKIIQGGLLMAFMLLVIVIVFAAFGFHHNPTQKTRFDPQEAKPDESLREQEESQSGDESHSKLSGGAFVLRSDGSSEIVRGLPISVCQADLANEMGDIRRNFKIGEEIADAGLEGFGTRLGARVFDLVEPHVVTTVRSNIDGKYEFSNLPSGNFILFAQLAASSNYVAWCIPITIEEGESVILDLENSNSLIVVNTRYGDRPDMDTFEGRRRDLDRKYAATQKLLHW